MANYKKKRDRSFPVPAWLIVIMIFVCVIVVALYVGRETETWVITGTVLESSISGRGRFGGTYQEAVIQGDDGVVYEYEKIELEQVTEFFSLGDRVNMIFQRTTYFPNISFTEIAQLELLQE